MTRQLSVRNGTEDVYVTEQQDKDNRDERARDDTEGMYEESDDVQHDDKKTKMKKKKTTLKKQKK